jgi:hypothetical protein
MTLNRENLTLKLREIESMILTQDSPVMIDLYTMTEKSVEPYTTTHAYIQAERERFSNMDDMIADLTTQHTL